MHLRFTTDTYTHYLRKTASTSLVSSYWQINPDSDTISGKYRLTKYFYSPTWSQLLYRFLKYVGSQYLSFFFRIVVLDNICFILVLETMSLWFGGATSALFYKFVGQSLHCYIILRCKVCIAPLMCGASYEGSISLSCKSWSKADFTQGKHCVTYRHFSYFFWGFLVNITK